MPSYQYPRSLLAQFPEDVYRNAGASDVLPLVMKDLDADKVLAVQFLRAGRVRLTFQDPETCAQVLKEGLDLGEFSVDLFPADDRLRTVHLRDLPVEIEEEVVLSFLAGFGEVLSVNHCFFDDYPSVRNGNRVAKVLLDRDIPQFVEIDGCNCGVWYPRQPPQCSVCKEFGHRAPTCPLSGRCRRCHQPGHMARECTQAWGPSFSVSRTDHSMEVEDDSDTSSSASDDVPSTTASVTSPVVTSPPVISTCPPVTSVRSTAAVPTSCPTVAATAPVKSSTGSVTMTTAASVTVPSASVVPVNAPSTSVSTASAPKSSASESDLPTSVSPVPVPTTSSAPTFGLSTSVSTASATPVCTPSLLTSASLTTSPASASSRKVDPGPTAFPESVTDQTTARAYLEKVMTKQISACDAKLFENWSRTNTNHFSDWTIESYSVPSQYKNIVMEFAKQLGYEYKMKYFGT